MTRLTLFFLQPSYRLYIPIMLEFKTLSHEPSILCPPMWTTQSIFFVKLIISSNEDKSAWTIFSFSNFLFKLVLSETVKILHDFDNVSLNCSPNAPAAPVKRIF